LLTGLALVSAILISLELTTRLLEPVRSAIGTVVSPLRYVAQSPYRIGDEVGDVVATRQMLLERNALLEQQVLELSNISLRFLNLKQENQHLRELLGSQSRLPDAVLIAELVGVVPTVNTYQIIIDKGLNAGAKIGQAVIDSEGLFGQIVEVDQLTSRVLLITDTSHAVPVQINRNGVRSIAAGTGRMDRLELENVPISADIVQGDLVETSGLGGRFPQGYPVGFVDAMVVEPTASYAQVSVRPSALLDRSRHVLVVLEETP
jgi:rod shape-determining protein MreC